MTLATDGLFNAKAYRYAYADAATRIAASGFVAADVGVLALQLDNASLWILTDDSPVTWAQVGGITGLTNPMTTKGDLIAGAASGVATRLPVGTDGYQIVADAAQTLGVKWALPAVVKLDEQIVAGADASTITVTIPAGYRHMRLDLVGRTDEVAGFSTVRARANGDSGSNYDSQGQNGNGITVAAFQDIGGTSWHVGWLAGASAPASVPGSVEIELKDYARAQWEKVALVRSGLKTSTSAGGSFVLMSANWWRSTAAITSIVFSIETAAKKFKIGTVATLYGLA